MELNHTWYLTEIIFLQKRESKKNANGKWYQVLFEVSLDTNLCE